MNGKAGVLVVALLAALAAAVIGGLVLSNRSQDDIVCGPFGRRATIASGLRASLDQVKAAVASTASKEAKRQEIATFASRVDGHVHRFALLSGSADTAAQDRALAGALGLAKDAAESLAVSIQGTGSLAEGTKGLDASASRLREANVTAAPC